MVQSDKFICGDCRGIVNSKAAKSGGNAFTKLLLNLILPGITIFLGRRKKVPKICPYCSGDFLLPADLAETNEFLRSMDKVDSRL